MVFIPGANNGTWGMGMSRGSLFPYNLNGPMGYQNNPLPVNLSLPNRSFGSYQLTPGGITTENSWGFNNKVFGKKKKRYSNRCKAITNKGSRCKHKSKTKYCGHHK